MDNYSLANMAILLAGSRYQSEMHRVVEQGNKGEIGSSNAVLAGTYLLGLTDMAVLYIQTKNGESLADQLKSIDAKVLGFKDGTFADGGEIPKPDGPGEQTEQ